MRVCRFRFEQQPPPLTRAVERGRARVLFSFGCHSLPSCAIFRSPCLYVDIYIPCMVVGFALCPVPTTRESRWADGGRGQRATTICQNLGTPSVCCFLVFLAFFLSHSSMTYLGIDAFLPSDVAVVQDSGGGLIAVHRCNFGRGIGWCCAFLSVRRAATRSRPQQEYVLIGGLIHDKANPVFRACIPVGIFGVCTIAAFVHFGVYDRLVVFLVLQSAWCVRQQQCFGIVATMWYP